MSGRPGIWAAISQVCPSAGFICAEPAEAARFLNRMQRAFVERMNNQGRNMASIGCLNEKSLHAALKAWCMQPGDQTEVPVDGYVIDIVRGDLLIEVQTRNLSAIKAKLLRLTARCPVRLIYPIAQQKWIVKLPTDGHGKQCRRKSPKRGTLVQIFEELVSFPELLVNPNFSLHVVSIQEEEVRCHDRRRGWRRKGWITHERRLLHVMEEHVFESPADMEFLIPASLSDAFTTADLATALNTSRHFARKMAYCLDRMNLLTRMGKRGNAIVYGRSQSAHPQFQVRRVRALPPVRGE